MATPVETVPEAVELTLTDRCDACGAAAKAIAERPATAPLMFCGHHSAEHGPALLTQGWTLR